MTYIEITTDKGYPKEVFARDTGNSFIMTSSYMKDELHIFRLKYGLEPCQKWFKRKQNWIKYS